MIKKLLELYRHLFFTPTLISTCLTKVSNNGCIIIMSNKNLPTYLSVFVRLSVQYLFLASTVNEVSSMVENMIEEK